MRSYSLAFLCGVLLFQQFTFLPAKYWLFIVAFIILIIEIIFVKKYSFLRYLSAILSGFTWMLFYVHVLYSWNLSHEMEGKPLIVRGYIASIPNNANNQISFLFSLEKTHAIIKLSSQDVNLQNLRAGDHWQFVVKLKQIHGMMNP